MKRGLQRPLPKDRKYFRFRYRVIFVAFLLILPTASSALEQDSVSSLPGLVQCAAIVIDLIKDPHWLLKNPDKATIVRVQGCIQTVSHTLEMMKHAQPSTKGAELIGVSGYQLYKSTKLYERVNGLAVNVEKYKEDFNLLVKQLAVINDCINKNIEPHWRNSSATKVVRNLLETIIEKLISFVNRLNELAYHIEKDIMQVSVEKTWCYGCSVAGGIVCVCSLFAGIPLLIIPTCSLSGITIAHSYQSHNSLTETLEEFKLLQKAIIKKRNKITATQAALKVVKRKVDIDM